VILETVTLETVVLGKDGVGASEAGGSDKRRRTLKALQSPFGAAETPDNMAKATTAKATRKLFPPR